jgi:hypothetical protein
VEWAAGGAAHPGRPLRPARLGPAAHSTVSRRTFAQEHHHVFFPFP